MDKIGGLVIAVALVLFGASTVCNSISNIEQSRQISTLEQQLSNCTCSVSYGGHNMSVEDALERSGEGLSIDQWKEVQVMIQNALSESR